MLVVEDAEISTACTQACSVMKVSHIPLNSGESSSLALASCSVDLFHTEKITVESRRRAPHARGE